MMRPDMNWFSVLEHHANRTPDKPLVVFGDEFVTYRGMVERSVAMAAGLRERGVGRGDVVGLLSYNNIEFLITIFGTNCLGAIVMPLNWRLAAPEIRYILEHSEARALVCDGALIDTANEATQKLGGLIRVCVSPVAVDGWDPFVTLSDPPDPSQRARADGDDIHRLMYTSGTTGRPKGVMITHANLAWKNYAHIAQFGFTEGDVGLACGPLYHVGALDLTTTSLIAAGATTILHPTFDAESVVRKLNAPG